MRLQRLGALLGAMLIVTAVTAPVATAALLVTAEDDEYTAVHDRLLSVSAAAGVLANDSGVGLTAAKITNPAHGTLTLSSNGSFTYRPTAGYTGSDSFIYEARVLSLGILVTDQAVVTLTVTNTAPVAKADAYSAVAGVEKTVAAPGLLANDVDADGDSLTVDIVTEPANGNLNEDDDGSFRYKADDGFSGTDKFTYRVFDGIEWSNTTTVTMTVSAATPTPTPTPAPTATPTPTPAPTPTPTPTPIISLPTLVPLPTLFPTPTPTPTPTPRVTPTPGATATPSASPTATPGASGQPSPGGSTAPTPTPSPGAAGTSPTPGASSPDSTPGTGAGSAGGSGGSSIGLGAAPGDRFLLPAVDPTDIDAILDASFAGFGGIEWAVPAFALGVPGLLVMIAVAAQAIVGAAWLPFVRRWLGGFGVRRRQRSA